MCSNFEGNKKLENYVETTFLTPCLGVQYVVKTPFTSFPLGYFLRNMGAVSDEHFEGSIRIYTEWKKKGIVANETQICWLITAERWYGRHQQKNTRDKRRQNVFLCYIYLFLDRMLYMDTIFTF